MSYCLIFLVKIGVNLDTILGKIVKHKYTELKKTKSKRPFKELIGAVESMKSSARFSFYDALAKKDGVNIIAEVKRGSPSKGIICTEFDHTCIAKSYESSGAAAISVLTDEEFFFGRLSYLEDIRREVRLPLLRKDFIIDEYQIYEAKAAGADAILLIAAVLDKPDIVNFLALTHELGMDALVEVHNKLELGKILTTKARIIGINNRNLKNFTVDLNTTTELAVDIPKKKVIVSESGINTRADIELLLESGINSFLIGEALVRDGGMSTKMRELLGK